MRGADRVSPRPRQHDRGVPPRASGVRDRRPRTSARAVLPSDDVTLANPLPDPGSAGQMSRRRQERQPRTSPAARFVSTSCRDTPLRTLPTWSSLNGPRCSWLIARPRFGYRYESRRSSDERETRGTSPIATPTPSRPIGRSARSSSRRPRQRDPSEPSTRLHLVRDPPELGPRRGQLDQERLGPRPDLQRPAVGGEKLADSVLRVQDVPFSGGPPIAIDHAQ